MEMNNGREKRAKCISGSPQNVTSPQVLSSELKLFIFYFTLKDTIYIYYVECNNKTLTMLNCKGKLYNFYF
jgi:hypothetical protein